MRTIAFSLLYITALVIGIATFAEDAFGTGYAHKNIYGTIWFGILWFLLIAISSALIVRRRLWKHLPLFLLHLSFGIIFAGASVTALTARKGMLHLRKDMASGEYVTPARQICPLPFNIRLDSFYVEYYAGTETPSDYVSRITRLNPDGSAAETYKISMNRIYATKGYRFYQSSYDEDRQGSWLTVNYDPLGTALVYIGFLLFGIGSILTLFSKDGEFRRLLRHPLFRKGGIFILLFGLFGNMNVRASLPVVKRAQADSLASGRIVYNGRISPFNTLAKDFVQKIYGRQTFRGLTPEQVISSWQLYPDEWSNVPIINIKSAELRHRLNLKGRYARLSDLFDGPQYRLQPLWQQEENRQGKMAKAIRETDEKVGLILMLNQGTLIQPVPAGVPLPDGNKIQAEILYNRIPFSKFLFMANLTLGFLAFGLLIYRILKDKRSTIWENRLWCTALCLSALFHASSYLLRWYISGNIPLNNGFETMQFVALVILGLSIPLHRRFRYILPFGFLLSGFTLLVAHLSEMNPQITPLMPVLSSPWLGFHVSLIMISYALFAFVFLNGILALFLMARKRKNRDHRTLPVQRIRLLQLTLLSRILLYPAEMMLGIGIILGAVWANVSWGSYWSWDPKEVWALIAFIVYGNAFHRKSMAWLRKPLFFHIYMLLAFGVVLMTYFGVNYLLDGMHSYANT